MTQAIAKKTSLYKRDLNLVVRDSDRPVKNGRFTKS